jgi:hypothetical protein
MAAKWAETGHCSTWNNDVYQYGSGALKRILDADIY